MVLDETLNDPNAGFEVNEQLQLALMSVEDHSSEFRFGGPGLPNEGLPPGVLPALLFDDDDSEEEDMDDEDNFDDMDDDFDDDFDDEEDFDDDDYEDEDEDYDYEEDVDYDDFDE
jgi:hypothetical protein